MRLSTIITLLLATDCSGFAAKKGGKRNRAPAKKSGGGGFGAAPTKVAPPSSNQPELQEIILGPAKTVYINVPPDQLGPNQINKKDMKKFESAPAGSSARAAMLDKYGELRGRGDVVWPSSLQLARLIANCPSFVSGRRCIDIGSGLGLASLAILLGKPSKLAVSDIDEEVLRLAIRSCTEQIDVMPKPSIKAVDRLVLDWSDSSTWPKARGEFDFACASDVLYDADAAVHLAKLLSYLIVAEEGSVATSNIGEDGEEIIGRALLVDPSNRENRDKFVEEAAKNGLEVEVLPFPGNEEDFKLISVTQADL